MYLFVFPHDLKIMLFVKVDKRIALLATMAIATEFGEALTLLTTLNRFPSPV